MGHNPPDETPKAIVTEAWDDYLGMLSIIETAHSIMVLPTANAAAMYADLTAEDDDSGA